MKVSLQAVASETKVSRNYIYSTPKALEREVAARNRSEKNHPRRLPEVRDQRGSSDDSLRMRLAAALASIDDLTRELARISEENAALIAEVIELQNPMPKNVAPMRRQKSGGGCLTGLCANC